MMMTVSLFDSIAQHGHETILTCYDAQAGLKGFIGLHNTTLGPGLGGCRVMRYASESAAFADVLALSEAMTYKNSLAGLPYGGGKAVIWLQEGQEKTPDLIDAMARCIHTLGGNYFTATDIGSTSADMKRMKAISPYVSALSPEDGGLGDSSILTGLGVYQGIRAAVKHRLGKTSLDGLKIAIQGAGKVAYHMMSHLTQEDVTIYIADTNAEAIAKCQAAYPNIKVVAPSEIWHQQVDILSPNAIGGTVTEDVLANTSATIIAGGANNPLRDRSVATQAAVAEILFAPDFAINSGGVIVLSTELAKGTIEEAKAKTLGIYETALRVFEVAESRKINTLEAAIALAKENIANYAKL
jgi:glutamate dehydrogenase/leucine dehydrogenase